MELYLFIAIYLSLVFSYISYKTEMLTFAYILLIIAGLNLVALTIILLNGCKYNI